VLVSATLKTRFPGVYAVGDVATAGVPKAGVFTEGAARVVAQTLIAELYDGGSPERHLGRCTCYIEFGAGRIGSVDIDFLSGPEKTGTFNVPSAEQMALKERFGSSRRLRWFGSRPEPVPRASSSTINYPAKTGCTGQLSKQAPAWQRIRELHAQRFGKEPRREDA
jgi:hypothetical protein